MLTICWAIRVVAAVGPLAQTQDRPAALIRLEQLRAAIQTAELVTRTVDYQEAKTRGWPMREVTRQVRRAGDTQIVINRGDADGVVMLTPDGQPNPLHGRVPRASFRAPGLAVDRSDDPLSLAYVEERNPRLRDDIRALGLSAAPATVDLHDVLWWENVANPEAPSYAERDENGLHVVEVRRGPRATTYWLDPSHGGMPVRVREAGESGAWSECRSTLELKDGVWFPSAVEYYSSQFGDGREPTRVERVQSATFNRPEHAGTLSPADIGLEVGMIVQSIGKGPAFGSAGRWDGQRMISGEEFVRRVGSGELTVGSRFAKALAQRAAGIGAGPVEAGVAGAPVPAQQSVGLWEAYARAFIARYALSDEQSRKVWEVVRDCQGQADEYLRRNVMRFEDLERRRADLASSPGGDDRAARQAEVARFEAELRKPIDDIFERRLKPRLEVIPTRAQRAAAEKGERGDRTPVPP